MSIYLDEFETLYGISDNIEKLRSKILELAFKGKLVSQNENDNSVFKLVNKMKKEKPKKFKNKTEDFPYKIPKNWNWMKHSQIFDISGGSQPPKSKFIYEPQEGYIRLYQTRDYGDNPQPAYIPLEDARKKSKEGEILLARYGGSLGKVFRAKNGAYNVALVKVELLYDIDYINNDFLFYFYKSDLYQKFTNNQSRSAQSGFNKSDFNNLKFPLPPLEEQKRIVDKIEKLMKEVDKLETKLEKKEDISQNLSESIVEAIKNSQDAEELKQNLSFIIDNFDVIFKTSKSMDEMRNIVLQLAVEGKLVPQYENDEPASELIEKLKKSRKLMIEENIIKKTRYKRKEIKNKEIKFKIPDSWKWLRLIDIGSIVSGGTPKTNVSKYWNGDISWVTPADINKNSIFIEKGRRNITQIGLKNSSAKLIPKGSILFSSRAPIGKTAIAKNKISTNQGFKSIVPYIKDTNKYIYYFLKRDADRINNEASGTTFNEISGTEMANLLIPFPPLEEQKRIVKKVESIMSIIDKLEKELTKKEDLVEKLGSI